MVADVGLPFDFTLRDFTLRRRGRLGGIQGPQHQQPYTKKAPREGLPLRCTWMHFPASGAGLFTDPSGGVVQRSNENAKIDP